MRLNLTITLSSWLVAFIELGHQHPNHLVIWACLIAQVYAVWRQRHIDDRDELISQLESAELERDRRLERVNAFWAAGRMSDDEWGAAVDRILGVHEEATCDVQAELIAAWDCGVMGHLLVVGSPQCWMCFHVEGTRCECAACVYSGEPNYRRGGDNAAEA